MSDFHLDKSTKSSSKKPQTTPEQEAQHHKPFRLQDADVMDLQRHLGNQATQNVLGVQRKPEGGLPSLPGIIQAKMTVNEPGDQYEHEADHVAHEVMTMPDPLQRAGEDEELAMKPIQRAAEEDELMEMPIQRAAEEDELMEMPIQRAAEEDELMEMPIQRAAEEDELMEMPIQRAAEDDELAMKPISSIQRDASAGVPPVTDNMESQINSAKGSGQPLPDDTRSFLEPRFGRDFSDVRIHTGAESNDLNNNLQARAFTTGSDIFFRDSDYNPNSDGGRELLAHELTHVVQQGGSSDLKTKRDDCDNC